MIEKKITGAAIEAALTAAGDVLGKAPKSVTPERMDAARAAWTWLALAPSRPAAGLLEARARGIAWETIGARLGVSVAEVRQQHRHALEHVAGRLNDALATE